MTNLRRSSLIKSSSSSELCISILTNDNLPNIGKQIELHLLDWIFINVFIDYDFNKRLAPKIFNHERVKIHRCDNKYWQKNLGDENPKMPIKQKFCIEKSFHYAKRKKIAWALSIDSDEIIYPMHKLRKSLNICKNSNLFFNLKLNNEEIIYLGKKNNQKACLKTGVLYTKRRHSKGDYSDLVKSLKTFSRVELPLKLKLRLIQIFTNDFFLGYSEGKILINTDMAIDIFGQHNVTLKSLPNISSRVPDVRILHFDSMGLRHFRYKWENRIYGKTKATAISVFRKRLTWFIKFMTLFSASGYATSFKLLYTFSRKEYEILEKNDAVRKIKITNE